MEISQIPVKFIFHSYSESSTFGRPGLGRSTLYFLSGNFTDPTLTTLISFLLWELIIWQTRGPDRSNPLSNGNFTDSCKIHISFILWELNIWQDQVLAQLPPSSKAISQIPTLVWELIFGRPSVGRITPCQMAISQIPALTAHIWWQLIFHSHSESSTFGRPGLGRSTPHFWVAISLTPTPDNSYFIPTLRAYHLEDQVLADLPPIIWVAISLISTLTTLISFLLWELIIWQTRSWQLLFHSYSESLSFGRPGPDRSTPHAMVISQIPALTAHYSELNIWQTRSWQIYPHIKWQFYRFLLYSESSYLADQVLAHLPPIKYWFHRRLFIGSHAAPADHLTLHLQIYHLIKHWFHRWLCMGSHAAPADHLKLCLQIYPAIKHWFHRWLCMDLTLHLQISPLNGNFTDFCSDSSYFIPTLRAHHLAYQVLAVLPPSNGDFTDFCEIHISFLLWELIIWQTRSWQIYPNLTAIVLIFGRPSVGRSNPPIKWHFHRFLLWQLTTLRAQHLADQGLGRSEPPHQMAILQIPALLWEPIFTRPPVKWWFHRFLWNSYFIHTLRAQHLADQVLAQLPTLLKGNFTDSYSSLRAHIW